MKQKLIKIIQRLQLQLGAYFLRKAVTLKVGQQISLQKAVRKGFKGSKIKRGATNMYVDNVFFNFKMNKIVYRFSEKMPTIGSANEPTR